MLLSRLAQNVFWLGRYLERGEDMARAIIAHDQLCLDMPKAWSPGFRPLLSMSGEAWSPESVEGRSEQERVLGCLVRDPDSPSSVISILARARDNLRVSRPIVPKECWNTLNGAYLSLVDTPASTSPSAMIRALDEVMRACQSVSAQLSGTMTRDDAYAFVRAGRFVERADMLLRITRVAHDLEAFDSSQPFEDVRWMGLLNALGAYHMYRRTHHGRADARRTLSFLLMDTRFPRSLAYSIGELRRALGVLPRSSGLVEQAVAVHPGTLPRDPAQPKEYADHLLVRLAHLSEGIESNYFN